MKDKPKKIKMKTTNSENSSSERKENINFLNKIEKLQEDALKKKVKKIEQRNKKDENGNSVNKKITIPNKVRRVIFNVLFILILLLIICIILFSTVIDTKDMVRNYEYSSNLSSLQRKLNKMIKQNEVIIDSKVLVYDTDGFELNLVDELYDYKNEYTLSSIGILNKKLVYLGTDEKFKKIAEKKGINTDYSLLYNMHMDESDFIIDEDTGTIEAYTRKNANNSNSR